MIQTFTKGNGKKQTLDVTAWSEMANLISPLVFNDKNRYYVLKGEYLVVTLTHADFNKVSNGVHKVLFIITGERQSLYAHRFVLTHDWHEVFHRYHTFCPTNLSIQI